MFLTIFTPTYNRVKLLSRLYASLLSQNDMDFEWLVVDDGSTDHTVELIQSFSEQQKIPIRYIHKQHGGKHTAFNVAMQNARGEFLLCIDSDDLLAEGAVGAIHAAISNLQPQDIGLIGYIANSNDRMLCDRIDRNSGHRGLYSYHRITGRGGEYSIIFRTELLRKYPFPEPKGEPYVSECFIYDRMEMDGYTFCPIYRVIELREYQKDGLSWNSYDYIFRSPTAQVLYHSQRLDLVQTYKERLGHALRYHAYNRMCGKKGTYHGKYLWLVRLTSPAAPFIELYFRCKWLKWKKDHKNH